MPSQSLLTIVLDNNHRNAILVKVVEFSANVRGIELFACARGATVVQLHFMRL